MRPVAAHLLRSTLLLGVAACAPAGAQHTPPLPPVATADARPLATERDPNRVLPRELTREEQVRHVLGRLAFGPRPGDVERVTGMGVDRWIAQQLEPARIPDRAMEHMLASYATLDRNAGELLRDFPPPAALLARRRLRGDTLAATDSAALRAMARENRRLLGEVMSARVARAVGSERQLQEVMTDFWLNHFSVFAGKGQLRYYLADYEREAIRPHALGRFRDLLGAVAKSPAMLLYLDNAQSVADSTHPTLANRGGAMRQRRVAAAMARRRATMSEEQRRRLDAIQARRPRGLNENYARELLELHTLGVDGGYTQRDIIEVARALTGWSVRPPRSGRSAFQFNGAAHDAGAKEVLGTHLRAGRGMEDGEEVLDLLARHPSTARFIARKLAVRFVSDTPPASLVDRAADAFRRTDGDIREVVRTIVTSPEFFSRPAYRAKVKSPFEVVVSAARALGAASDTSAVSALMVGRLGQPIYGHQAPDGWPETGEPWMNTGAILQRINFGLAIAASRIPGARVASWPPYDRLRDAPREAQVDAVVDAFLGGQASPETREILVRGENPLLGRDETDPAPPGRPERPRARAPRLAGLDQVIGLALGSPEFQRR